MTLGGNQPVRASWADSREVKCSIRSNSPSDLIPPAYPTLLYFPRLFREVNLAAENVLMFHVRRKLFSIESNFN